ncbi:MAG: tetratricopeptide repeat protein [Chloroherpetonaceae bacterium]|nr:tetratricopeptide repeat protein [Chloroherpetonaceae bacterium]MDW8438621.1 adenylate/guanylate cyclase domain-containing protein [Chloroherpetonaceae bacterium]
MRDALAKIDALNDSAWRCRNEQPKLALEMSENALRLSQEHSYRKGIADSQRNIGVCQYLLANYDAALSASDAALRLFEELGDKRGAATALNAIGNVYQSLGDYASALDFHSKSLGLRQELRDKQGESVSLNNIGNVYQKLGDYHSTLRCYEESLKIKQDAGDAVGEGAAMMNIANVYLQLDQKDVALDFYLKSLEIARSFRDRRGEANAFLNIGSFYHSLKDLKNALDSTLKAFDLFNEIQDRSSAIRTLCNVGIILNDIGNFDAALDCLNSALALAEDVNSKELIYDACKALSETYELRGDFKKALEYHKLYHQFKEDVFSEDARKRLRGLEAKFEIERIEREKEIYRLKHVEIKAEQEKSERLLLNILPKSVAERLKQGEQVIADYFKEATVLFADLVGFTTLSARFKPETLVVMLNDIFSSFDDIAERFGLEKIKTIGDAYMAVAGVPIPRDDHAEAVAEAALQMMSEMRRINAGGDVPISLRIGINSGPVVAGVIGTKKFIYDLWGDTVNTASRMESHSAPNEAQVTETTYRLLRHKFIFEPRGAIEVKGKGLMNAYFLKEKIEW